jgi:hypothetical protein
MAQQPTDPRSQADKFRDLARELGCDEDEKAFEEKVKRVGAPGRHKAPTDREKD